MDVNECPDVSVTPDRVAKRKRVTLSCLICKQRKVRCDKTVPCKHCVNRNEAHLCTYEEGHTPPTAEGSGDALAAESADLRQRVSRLESLHARVQRLEDYAAAGPSGSAAQSPAVANPGQTSLEQTFVALDYLCSRNAQGPATSLITALERTRPVALLTTAAWPNIVAVNPPPRPARWVRLMLENIAAIPDTETVDVLISIYSEQMGTFWNAVHPAVFQAEVAQFHAMRQSGTTINIDPAWLALLLSILHLSAFVTIIEHPVSRDPAAHHQRHELVRSLGDAFDSTVFCAGGMRSPQFRLLQAFIPIIHASYIDDQYVGFDGSTGGQHWLNRALNICREAKYHRLDVDVISNTQDPGFPPGNSLYKREMIARVVHTVFLLERIRGTVLADMGVASSSFIVDDVTTPYPGNYYNAALWPSTGDLKEQPPWIPVESTLQGHFFKMSRHWQRVSQLLREPERLTPEAAAECDASILRDERALMGIVYPKGKQTMWDEIVRASIRGSYHLRRLRLHRHLSLRLPGDLDARTAALTAAHDVIHIHHQIATKYKRAIPSLLSIVFYAHDVSAAVTLFIHGCLDAAVRQANFDDIRLAHGLLECKYIGGAKRHEALVGRGLAQVTAMLGREHNPPRSLAEIETFLLEFRDERPQAPQGPLAGAVDNVANDMLFDESALLDIE
ncbi:hypothetical protein Q5752_000791 [Cryptotrichosporon argae]